MKADRLVVSNIKGWEGAIAVSSTADSGCIASNRFLSYVPRRDTQIDVRWAHWYFLSEPGRALIQHASPGSADRNRTLAVNRFESLVIPLPLIDEQRRVADRMDRVSRMKATIDTLKHRAGVMSAALSISISSPSDFEEETRSGARWRRAKLGEFLVPAALNEAFAGVS